ncbi:MAG TPA: hypothetical protein VIU62_05635 [Chloroflexota bacterium]
MHLPRLLALVLMVAVIVLGSWPWNGASAAGDPRYFVQTGYRIDNDAFYDYFAHRGGIRTFGYPTSETFTLLGFRVQFFQRRVMQLQSDGSVGLLNLLDPGILPYTQFNGSTFPAVDAGLTASAPSAGSTGYAAAALAFVAAHAPDTFNGQPVHFAATFLSSVTAAEAFPNGQGNAALLPLMDLELWGLPTAPPNVDPANANFVYLRFQRGIMQYDATTGLTQGTLLADYLKAVMTGPGALGALPPDLAQEAAGSPYLAQWAPEQPLFLARPDALPNSDLTNAFYPVTVAGQPIVPTPVPGAATPTITATPLPSPTAAGNTCAGDERMTFAGGGSASIGDTVYITVTSSRGHTGVVLTGPDHPAFVKEYQGQEGYVWVYQVTVQSAGRHDYTYYVDTTTVCTTNYFVVGSASAATATSTPTATGTPTATATPVPTATATVGPKPSITDVNPTRFNRGQAITVNGGPFGAPPPGSGLGGANGSVFFFYQPGPAATAGVGTPTATPVSGSRSAPASVQTWTNGFLGVQVPNLAPSNGAIGSYCVQVTVNGAPPSDPFCGLQVSG